jgi:hypothetical protein
VTLAVSHAIHDFRKIVDRIGAENEIEIRRALEEIAFIQLPDAAPDSDQRSAAFFLEILKSPEPSSR